MMTRAKWEYLAATLILAIGLIFFVPAVLAARAEVRDNLRRTDVASLKHALEMYNNTHVHYGLPPGGEKGCTVGNDPASWMLGEDSPLLKEQHLDAIPHDVRENRGHVYLYCVTDVDSAGTAQGFYVQAELEVNQPEEAGFDQDESRKFDYRILHEDGKVLYRVCGGTETQCRPSAFER